MPITTDEFDHLPEEALDLTEGSNAQRVLTFLFEHPETAFRQNELIDNTNVNAGSIGPVLARLEERGLVRHKGKYWTLGQDDRLASYAAMAHTFATVEDRFPDEDMDEWLEHAEDPYADERSEDR
jgi:DNA-binding IclR family transcriptional regulator